MRTHLGRQSAEIGGLTRSAGAALAKRLDKKFVDLDAEIERRTGHNIPDIFAQEGEAAFRRYETDVLAEVAKSNSQVIACGGGGIPVVRDGQQLKGVEAVIDKDLASALLASQLGADLLVIPTGVEKMAINFGTPQQQWLDAISVAEAQTLLREGQFGVGSMQPKVEAIVDFINASQQQGKQASGLITSPQTIKAALAHQSGTWITL